MESGVRFPGAGTGQTGPGRPGSATPRILSLGADGSAWLVPPVAGTPLKLSAASAYRVAERLGDHATPAQWRNLTDAFAAVIRGFQVGWLAGARDCYYLERGSDGGPMLAVLTDRNRRPMAGRYRLVGGKHVNDLIQHAKDWHAEEGFDGILTFSESAVVAVVAVAAVAAALGLPGIGVDAARTSRNKLLMRRAHERGGAAHPRF
jgi:hypothetical protein